MPIDKHVIDTNVLIVASAAHGTSPFAEDATPVDRAELRSAVLAWLIQFEQSQRCIVLDYKWEIVGEYRGDNRRDRLTEQDYGMQLVLQLWSTGRFCGFLLEYRADGSAHIGHPGLDLVITDIADRKMVAAVLAGGASSGGCSLVNACDTDWYDWQVEMEAADVYVEQLIHDWCFEKW